MTEGPGPSFPNEIEGALAASQLCIGATTVTRFPPLPLPFLHHRVAPVRSLIGLSQVVGIVGFTTRRSSDSMTDRSRHLPRYASIFVLYSPRISSTYVPLTTRLATGGNQLRLIDRFSQTRNISVTLTKYYHQSGDNSFLFYGYRAGDKRVMKSILRIAGESHEYICISTI